MNSIHCFAIKRGELKERFDPHFHHPHFRELLKKITDNDFLSLGEIIVQSSETWNIGSNLYIDRFPYIEISAVGLGTNEYFTTSTLVQQAPSRARQIVRTDDILISLTRPQRGAITRIRKSDDLAIASTGFAVLREIKLKDFDRDFLLNVLLSNICLPQLLQRSSGGNYPAITSDQLEKILVPKIDHDLQLRLVECLEKARRQHLAKLLQAEELLKGLDEYILTKLDFPLPPKNVVSNYAITKTKLNNRIDSYSNQPHFRELFNRLSQSKFEVLAIKSISSRIISGSTPLSGGDAYTQHPHGIRFIRSGEITSDGSVIAKSEIYIKEEIHNVSLKRSQLKKNDVLIAIVGATIGQVGIYEYEEEANINQAIAAVSITNPKVLPQYLCWYLKSSLGQMILDYFKRPVARANINLDEIAQIPVIIPQQEIQQEIIDEVTRRKEEANKLKAEAETEWQNAKKWFEEQLLGNK